MLTAVCAPTPAIAQTLPQITLELDKNYYARSDRFTASGTIINTSPEHEQSAELSISIFPALDRGAQVFGGPRGNMQPVADEKWSRTISVGLTKVRMVQPLSALDLEEGVYPLEFAVKLSDHRTLIDRSFLIVLDPQLRKLPTAVVWSLHPGDRQLPDGRFADDHLGEMIRSNPQDPGSLVRYLGLIENNPALSINLATGPTLTHQLSDMARGYEWLDGSEVRKLTQDSSAAIDAKLWQERLFALAAAEQRVELLSAPVGEASPPLLASMGWDDDARDQIELAATDQTLPKEAADGGFYLPGLNIDKTTARQLLESGFKHTVTLKKERTGSTMTPSAPHFLETGDKRLNIFAADPEIAAWLTTARPEKAAVELTAILAQRLLLAGTNEMVVITPAADAPPGIELADRIFNVLTRLPWIETVTLSSVSDKATQPASLKSTRPATAFTSAYQGRLAASRRLLLDFSAAVPTNNAIKRQLERHLYRAQSIDFLPGGADGAADIGEAYIAGIDRTVKGEFAKVQLNPPRAITFSTRRGKIPIVVFNGAGYPFKANLNFAGKGFTFPDDMKDKIVLRPKENLISYDVVVDVTGLNILDVKVSVGDSEIASHGIEVTVSSVLRYLVVSISTLLIVGSGMFFVLRRQKR